MAWLVAVLRSVGLIEEPAPITTALFTPTRPPLPPNPIVHCSLCEKDAPCYTNYLYGQSRRGWQKLCENCEKVLWKWQTLSAQDLINYFGNNNSKAVYDALRYVNRSRQSRNSRMKRSSRGSKNGAKLKLLSPKLIQYKPPRVTRK